MTNGNATKAILLLNLGGPETLDDVKPFLYRLFEDPEILRIKSAPLRRFLAWLIATTRAGKSKAMYAAIGGGSPIRRLTDEQAEKTELSLKREKRDARVRTAFSCSQPLIEDVVKGLAEDGATRFLALPLYPQYSFTTTRGSLARARKAVEKWAPQARYFEVISWPTNPLFVAAHADLIRQEVRTFADPTEMNIHLLFSAHSIPEKLVTHEGDPYKKDVEASVKAVIDHLAWKGPYSLSWQSKLGPIKWLEPSTSDAIKRLGEGGAKQILVVPIAFVSDHIETIYEIDQMLAAEAKEAGVREFRRTRGLNSHPMFIEALVDVAKSNKEFWT